MKSLFVLLAVAASVLHSAEIRIGMVGCDTSHATAFTAILNDANAKNHVSGARVVAAFKASSPDLDDSAGRIDRFVTELREKWGVRFHDTIEDMCKGVDAVLIESVDGRPHLSQAKAVIDCGKPVFIDKPLAHNLHDAIAIADYAKKKGVPIWTGSSYRWQSSMTELKAARVGEIRGAISYGPAHLEKHHTDLTWYGIHPTEALYTVMGQGCQRVVRIKTPDTDVVTGEWSGGRTGTLVGLRTKPLPHKVIVFGSTGSAEQSDVPHDYSPLVEEIVKFFSSGNPPVPTEETLEMFAFMEAADESARLGGNPVNLSDVFAKARK